MQSERGAGWYFGESVVKKFLEANDMDYVVRAHQIALDGYNKHFGGLVLTVWSAPNYMNRFKNVACVMELDENKESLFKIFESAPVEEYNLGKAARAAGSGGNRFKYFV